MKLMIEIHEEDYKDIKENGFNGYRDQENRITEAISEGVPMKEWISTGETPPEGEDVLIVDTDGNYHIGSYFDDTALEDGGRGFETDNDILDIADVSYCYSLPVNPLNKKEK